MGGNVCKGRGSSPDDPEHQNQYLQSRFKLGDEKILEYRSLFKEFSSGGKLIERNNFRKVYHIVYQHDDTDAFADRVFDAMDLNKSENLDFIEFAVGLSMIDSKQIEQKISMAFNMFDEDRNHALSKQEIVDVIQAYYRLLGNHKPESSATEIAVELFEKMDLNKDKKVTYEEFTSVAKKDPTILEILDPQA